MTKDNTCMGLTKKDIEKALEKADKEQKKVLDYQPNQEDWEEYIRHAVRQGYENLAVNKVRELTYQKLKEGMERALDRELIASIIHDIWCHWMNYLLDKVEVKDIEDYARWTRQRDTDYANLSEKEKESDCHQADKIITAIREEIENLTKPKE